MAGQLQQKQNILELGFKPLLMRNDKIISGPVVGLDLKEARPGVILKQLGIADVTPQGVHRFVP
jgi:hypothetical protein